MKEVDISNLTSNYSELLAEKSLFAAPCCLTVKTDPANLYKIFKTADFAEEQKTF